MEKTLSQMFRLKMSSLFPLFKSFLLLLAKNELCGDMIRFLLTNTTRSIITNYHKKYFQALCSKLSKYTEKCTVSFIDLYRNTARNTKPLNIRTLTNDEVLELMSSFILVAKEEGIDIDTCAEEYDLSSLGISHACCIDKQRLERLGNYTLNIGKDKNQRGVCGCIESIDIGMYNTCENGCAYCYANYNPSMAATNHALHDPKLPLICGDIKENDNINIRKVKSNIDTQMRLF